MAACLAKCSSGSGVDIEGIQNKLRAVIAESSVMISLFMLVLMGFSFILSRMFVSSLNLYTQWKMMSAIANPPFKPAVVTQYASLGDDEVYASETYNPTNVVSYSDSINNALSALQTKYNDYNNSIMKYYQDQGKPTPPQDLVDKNVLDSALDE